VIESLSKRILLKSIEERYWYNRSEPPIEISLSVNPREQHVLVHAWRTISERVAPVKLDWGEVTRGGCHNLTLVAQRTELPLKLDTFEAYAQDRATTTCVILPAGETGAPSLIQRMDQEWNIWRAVQLNRIITKLIMAIAAKKRPLATQDIHINHYLLDAALVAQVFDTLLAPRGYTAMQSFGHEFDGYHIHDGWRLVHPHGIQETSCVVQ
jgi:hypothetical protein